MLAAGATLVAFATIERRSAHPLVSLRIFGDRRYSVANALAVLANMAMYPTFFLLTLYLQSVLRLSPLGAGIAFLALSGSLLVSTLNGPRLAYRFGTRRTLLVSTSLTAAGLAWFGFISPHGSVLVDVIGPSIVTGLGAGVTWTTSATAATAGSTPSDAGLRSGVLIASQQVGGATGVGVIVAIAVALGGTTTDNSAFTTGLSAGFWIAAGIAGLGVVAALLLRPEPGSVAVTIPSATRPAMRELRGPEPSCE